MRRKYSVLQRIDHSRKITIDSDFTFLYHLQCALLLALREQGRLSPMQHRQAEDRLMQQRIFRARNILEKEKQL